MPAINKEELCHDPCTMTTTSGKFNNGPDRRTVETSDSGGMHSHACAQANRTGTLGGHRDIQTCVNIRNRDMHMFVGVGACAFAE